MGRGQPRKCSRFQELPLHQHEFSDKVIHLVQKILAAVMRVLGKYRGGVFGQFDLAGLARPATHLTVGEEGKAPQLALAACVHEIGEQVVESQLECG